MENLKTSSRILLFFTILSGSLWMGAYFTRLMTSYQIFEGTTFALRSYLNNVNLPAVLQAFEPAILATFILYIIFVVFFILFITTSKISLKKNGWFFIIIVLIGITMPMEIYLLTIDYKLIIALNTPGFNPNDVLDLIISRFRIFSSFPVIEMFCYFSVIYFLIFKPLTKKDPDKI